MKAHLREDYISRINKVFQFLDQNLNEELSLETLSGLANFSPFHFHRIFKYITGETLNEYIIRKRVEKAASMLIHKLEMGVTEIAILSGFNSNSSFSRSFRKFYGLSPSGFRNRHQQKFSKISQQESKNGEEHPGYEKYICAIKNLQIWLEMNTKIELKELPQLQIAFVSSIGPQNLESAFNNLLKWAKPKGLLDKQEVKLLTIYHDSFKITAPEKVRMSASLILDHKMETSGEVSAGSIEKGKFLTGRFLITRDEFEKAWTSLFVWMNENGYKKADRNPFELYYNNFREHPEQKFDVELFIPVE